MNPESVFLYGSLNLQHNNGFQLPPQNLGSTTTLLYGILIYQMGIGTTVLGKALVSNFCATSLSLNDFKRTNAN